jgi:hypothetical protein
MYHPEMLLRDGGKWAPAALRVLGAGGETWDCTQHPGEVVLIPRHFLHATVNLDESVAVAVQCDDGADPRAGVASYWRAYYIYIIFSVSIYVTIICVYSTPIACILYVCVHVTPRVRAVGAGLSELNALIVHANGADGLGLCGTPWDSPFGILGAAKALEMLETLSDHFRGNPATFLNRAARDDRAPADVAVEFGSVRVAQVLVAQGLRFLPRHQVEAKQHGHTELATLIGNQLHQR